MKIIIKADDYNTENEDLVIHNEDTNNENFVQLQFAKTETYLDVSVDDLYFAIKTFRDMREERLYLESLMDE